MPQAMAKLFILAGCDVKTVLENNHNSTALRRLGE